MAENQDTFAHGTGTNFQKLRALMGWLHLTERAAATELGISRTLLREILTGGKSPDYEVRARILVMSRRWPYGLIVLEDWPPPLTDRRKRDMRNVKSGAAK